MINSKRQNLRVRFLISNYHSPLQFSPIATNFSVPTTTTTINIDVGLVGPSLERMAQTQKNTVYVRINYKVENRNPHQ